MRNQAYIEFFRGLDPALARVLRDEDSISDRWRSIRKRTFDIALALPLCLLASPFLIVLGVLVRLTSRGPAIYWSIRVGRDNRIFRMPKLRSMHEYAPQLATHLFSDAGQFLTPIGQFLRRTSLDELPQLWNVIRGEMSLVGPRPLPLYETANFGDVSQRRRMSVRPGLTCLWQVRGRNQITDFKDWVRLDLEYIDRWTFWLDLEILVRTIPVVLFGWGAK